MNSFQLTARILTETNLDVCVQLPRTIRKLPCSTNAANQQQQHPLKKSDRWIKCELRLRSWEETESTYKAIIKQYSDWPRPFRIFPKNVESVKYDGWWEMDTPHRSKWKMTESRRKNLTVKGYLWFGSLHLVFHCSLDSCTQWPSD